MDVNMPGRNGIEATRCILSAAPHVGIFMLTMFDDDEFVFAAIRLRARGYTHVLGWSSRDPRETPATQPSAWAGLMRSSSGPRM